jgi:hypothetical protein
MHVSGLRLGGLVAATTIGFAASLVGGIPTLRAQQGQPSPDRPSVQVGVPEGRGGAGQGGVQVGVPEGRAGGGRQGGRGRQAGPSRPAPRGTDGRVLLSGATPGDKGVWLPGAVVPNPLGVTEIPYQPWAKALWEDRQKNELEPHTRCKPSGVARQFLTPYGVEIVELPELQAVFIFDIGGPHTYRTVYMDGRAHPRNVQPSYYGHSIGWWEGDTLVVDTTGFNEGFWIDRDGMPHTERLHTVERLTRVDAATLRYELMLDDPGAYSRPWKGQMNLRWEAGTELFEYVCQEANYAPELMVGGHESVDRSTLIVP